MINNGRFKKGHIPVKRSRESFQLAAIKGVATRIKKGSY